MEYLLNDLINQIADRAELDYEDILEDLYLKIHNYHVPMYRDIMIALYFLKKDEEQVVAYYNLPNVDTVRYIKDSVVEIKKVVWPPKNEAWRNTFFVLIFTAVLTLFLWLVDSFLVWLFTKIAE